MARCIRLIALVAAVVLTTIPAGCLRPRGGSRRAVTEAALALPKEMRCAADNSVLLLVPGGEFVMGPPGQEKRVTLPPFYMDRLEVTNAQYAKFLAAVAKQGDAAWRHPGQPASKRSHVPAMWSHADLGEAKADRPVVGVDWFDAYAYAKWADKRVPTEAEWEKAARGTDGRPYPWGSAPPEKGFRYLASFFGTHLGADGFRFTAPVGSFPAGASPCGCLDMAGNAAEWCADWFGPPPAEPRLANPPGPAAGTERVTKGGAWNLNAESLHSYNRWPLAPERRIANVGFRCARDAPPEALSPAR
ncbi:MAG TPA: SUMF1/EgtB/PvdO family nonheme iron enzyme [Planctomycetota bacterium]|nr:SUMF1/EgtB/PvdO family nonheme iron enzyme [Planctomycetota bacterium]